MPRLKNDGLGNRRAKIVCTLGPASSTYECVAELIDAGMNVARLNMSHGDYAAHEHRLGLVRQAAKAAGRPVGVFADLQGPKIRLGRFADDRVELEPGARFTITIEECWGDVNRCSTTLKTLTNDVSPGDEILVNDGAIHLRALEVTDTDVVTEVIVGGPVSDNKGINLPGVAVSVPALSEKDAEDLRWALVNGVDMIALSFVRSAKDIEPVHAIMDEVGRRIPVIAKIEKPQAMKDLVGISQAFDAVMVARGDLGVELPFEDVPNAQQEIITVARMNAKPVIVATQMLESMISAPRPTRAEATDVANAILNGADAVMLSGETAVGKYPIEAVDTMARIIRKTESFGLDKIMPLDWDPHTTGGIIAKAAAEVAERVEARYLAAFTMSGDTAVRLGRLRKPIEILAFCPNQEVSQTMTLAWGIKAFATPQYESVEEMIHGMVEILREENLVKSGERVVLVTGNPGDGPGKTAALRVVDFD